MKKDRGAITLIVLITVLFMVSFLVSTFVVISNRRQAQEEIKRETKELYEKDIDTAEHVYNEYVAESTETIPIFSAEQLMKIGTNSTEIIDNKIYKLSSNSNYILMENIEFASAYYSKVYQSLFQNETIIENKTNVTVKKWKGINSQLSTGGNFNYNGYKIKEVIGKSTIITHQ